MIELKNAGQLSRASAIARVSNLLVQPTSIFRMYRVTNRENGHQYLVNFFVRDGHRYGACNCKAGEHHKACKHLAAAVALHLVIAAERAANQRTQTSH